MVCVFVCATFFLCQYYLHSGNRIELKCILIEKLHVDYNTKVGGLNKMVVSLTDVAYNLSARRKYVHAETRGIYALRFVSPSQDTF